MKYIYTIKITDLLNGDSWTSSVTNYVPYHVFKFNLWNTNYKREVFEYLVSEETYDTLKAILGEHLSEL
jgi:hypothetical protein